MTRHGVKRESERWKSFASARPTEPRFVSLLSRREAENDPRARKRSLAYKTAVCRHVLSKS